ncbi:MAG: tetratricopeptide repeat protein [Flavobacteriales bacterium]|nr:tetratricopeptide repeat protein [Flavobacteriales bacterium]
MKKLKKYILFLGLFWWTFSSFSQGTIDVEEFKKALESNLDLDQLKKNPVLDMERSDSLFESINKGGDSLFEPKFYHLLGKLNAEKGNFAVSIEYFNTAEEYRKETNLRDFFVHNLLDRGNVYYKNGDFEAAEKDYQTALSLATTLNDEASRAIAFNNLGLLELHRKNFDLASGLFNDALSIRKKLNDPFLVAHSLTYLAMLHFHQEQFESAISYYLQAKDVYSTLQKDKRDQRFQIQITKLNNELGFCFYRQNKPEKAILYADSAVLFSEQIESNYDRASLLYQAAKVIFYAKETQKALEIAYKINGLAAEYHFKDILQKNYDLMADCFEAQKNYEKAIEYARKSHQMKDQIVNDRMAKKLADERLSFQVMTNRKLLKMAEKENELKSIELKAQERISMLMGIIALIAFLTVGSLFYSNRQKMKVNQKLLETNKLIETQNEEIKKQQEQLSQANLKLQKKFTEIEEMDDEKSHLLSIVAHDLRTPLNSILGLCDLLEMEEADSGEVNPDRKRYIELIKESGGRMLNMINTLLNARKIESQQLDIKTEEVDVNLILEKIISEHRPWSKRKSINIINELKTPPPVLADKFLFQQVLENLVTNAIKYSPINSSVKVVSEVNDRFLAIKVIDNGPGISRDDQQRLFTKYQRLSAQPTGGEDSIGIGLSLVKKLIELMDGSVSCTSELGLGSTFQINIPLAT